MASEYRLTGRLEEGQLAELYRATRDGSHSVVVKLFHEKTTLPAYAQAIAETQNALAPLTHPGIAHVIDIGVVKRRLAIVREDNGGYTLGQVLQRLNTKEVVLTSSLAMTLVIDLLEAVQQAHAAGVVHGAMTPGNVLVSSEGRPSICDFGALAALNSVALLKKTFAARGRSSYRAPEVAKGEPLSVASDVYSLGAMTYELLTLKEAAGANAHVSVRREALPPPSRVDRRLNSRIDPIIMRALDAAPGRRYKSAGEMAQALREFLTANGGAPPREDLKRFVAQLFPNDVQIVLSTHVAFSEAFTLAGVEGVTVDDLEERSLVLDARPSFSGGTLDDMPVVDLDMAPTEAMPALELTEPEREPTPNWHAPPAAMPVTARSGPKESINPDVLKRVKRIEDFAPVPGAEDTLPTLHRIESAPLPKVFPGRPEPEVSEQAKSDAKAATVATPAESQPLSGENLIRTPDGKLRRMITEERNLFAFEAARKRWIPLVAGAALVAIAFLMIGMLRWQEGSELQVYGPPPPERIRPMPVRRPAAVGPKADPSPPPRPPPVEDCYQAPKKGLVGFISVSAPRPVSVSIDGAVVCGSLQRIPAAAGARRLVVIDTRTKEEYVSTTRIEAGKQSRLIPIFKGR